MSIYIPGMEMPKDCLVCPLRHYYFPPTTFTSNEKTVKGVAVCMATRREIKADNCPLVPVPEHGDLIDRDALISEHSLTRYDWSDVVDVEDIKASPTIIPAEEGGG